MSFFKRLKLKSLLKKAKKLHQVRDQGEAGGFKLEIAALKELTHFFDANRFNKKFPDAQLQALEYYRAAAALDDAQAQHQLSQRLFAIARFYDEWEKNIYGSPIHKKYAEFYYEDAFKYLKQAETGGYALAKRFHGLAYINGWGVAKDSEKGFQMVIDSIEMEQAWERASKIFEELKLNSPEFFNAIMKHKAKNNVNS